MSLSVQVAEGAVLEACRALMSRRYDDAGYGPRHEYPSGARHVTLAALEDGEVAATVTLTLDGRGGLSVERTFADVVAEMRLRGGQPCELTRLAIAKGCSSQDLMAGLFRAAWVRGTVLSDATDLLIEVCPHHARFYRDALGFHFVGHARMDRDAQAIMQLLHRPVEAISSSVSAPQTAPRRSLFRRMAELIPSSDRAARRLA